MHACGKARTKAGILVMERHLQLPNLGQKRLQLPWRTAEGAQGTPLCPARAPSQSMQGPPKTGPMLWALEGLAEEGPGEPS